MHSGRCLLLLAAFAIVSSWCGTITNVTAPTTPSSGYRAFGPTWCEPFGGVHGSVLGGSAPLMAGPIGIIPAAVMVGLDTPLSLVGDLATLPIVYYRLRSRTQGDQQCRAYGIDQGPPFPSPTETPEK